VFAPHSHTPPSPPSLHTHTRIEMMTREGFEGVPEGVPSNGLVFGAFSNLGKVNVRVWSVWCRVLVRSRAVTLWGTFGREICVRYAECCSVLQ